MGRNRRAQKGEVGGRWRVSSESGEGTYHMVSRAKKDGDGEGEDAERVRRDLGETCHNDKPGRNDGDGGSRYEDEGGMRAEAGVTSCDSSKPCPVYEKMEASGPGDATSLQEPLCPKTLCIRSEELRQLKFSAPTRNLPQSFQEFLPDKDARQCQKFRNPQGSSLSTRQPTKRRQEITKASTKATPGT